MWVDKGRGKVTALAGIVGLLVIVVIVFLAVGLLRAAVDALLEYRRAHNGNP